MNKLTFSVTPDSSQIQAQKDMVDEQLIFQAKTEEGCSIWMSYLQNASKRKLSDFYTVGKLIGSGGFAKVFIGKCRATNEYRAIKRIEKKSAPSKVLGTEIAILKKVDHPNIVTTYDVFETDEEIQIVMEYMRGGMLYEAIEDGVRFKEADIVQFMRELLDGMMYLHEEGIVHRDMKPENVLCTSRKPPLQVKIADFGLSAMTSVANMRASNMMMSTMIGTPEFIAPEIARQQKYTSKVDMWALGMLCYNVIAGCLPLDEKKDMIKQLKVGIKLTFPEKEWNYYSPAARSFVRSLLCDMAEKRLCPMGCLVHAWLDDRSWKPTMVAPCGRFSTLMLESSPSLPTEAMLPSVKARLNWKKGQQSIRAILRLCRDFPRLRDQLRTFIALPPSLKLQILPPLTPTGKSSSKGTPKSARRSTPRSIPRSSGKDTPRSARQGTPVSATKNTPFGTPRQNPWSSKKGTAEDLFDESSPAARGRAIPSNESRVGSGSYFGGVTRRGNSNDRNGSKHRQDSGSYTSKRVPSESGIQGQDRVRNDGDEEQRQRNNRKKTPFSMEDSKVSLRSTSGASSNGKGNAFSGNDSTGAHMSPAVNVLQMGTEDGSGNQWSEMEESPRSNLGSLKNMKSPGHLFFVNDDEQRGVSTRPRKKTGLKLGLKTEQIPESPLGRDEYNDMRSPILSEPVSGLAVEASPRKESSLLSSLGRLIPLTPKSKKGVSPFRRTLGRKKTTKTKEEGKSIIPGRKGSKRRGTEETSFSSLRTEESAMIDDLNLDEFGVQNIECDSDIFENSEIVSSQAGSSSQQRSDVELEGGKKRSLRNNIFSKMRGGGGEKTLRANFEKKSSRGILAKRSVRSGTADVGKSSGSDLSSPMTPIKESDSDRNPFQGGRVQ